MVYVTRQNKKKAYKVIILEGCFENSETKWIYKRRLVKHNVRNIGESEDFVSKTENLSATKRFVSSKLVRVFFSLKTRAIIAP